MKQPLTNRTTLMVTITLLALALPGFGQAKKEASDKKAEQKTKTTTTATTGKKELPVRPEVVEQNKGVKEPVVQPGTTPPLNKGDKGLPTNTIDPQQNLTNKAVGLELHEIVKEDAKAKPGNNPKERLVPVIFKWKGAAVNQGKLVALEAVLETVNTDGTTSRVSKKIVDLAVDKLIAETILLPMKEGTFARDFKLTLSGKCAGGEGVNRQAVAISASKQGSFPVPNSVEKKR